MTSEDWDGIERREIKTEDPAVVLVEQAAAIAAQRVARIHRRRVVAQSFLAGVLSVLVVALPAAFFIDRDRRQAALDRARFNCSQQTQMAEVQSVILEIGTELRLKNSRIGQDPVVREAIIDVFGPELVTRLYGKQEMNEREAVRKWAVALSDLRRLANLDCDKVLAIGGVKTVPNQPPLRTTTEKP